MGKINKVVPSKLFIPGANSNELSYVFIETCGEHENGSRYVFGMFQVKATSELYHTIIAQTVRNIVDYFEKTPLSITSHLNDSGSAAEFIFENALQYTNEQVTNYIADHGEQEDFDIKKISMVIGMVWDNELYMSSLGKDITAYYLYPVQKKDSFSHYNAVSILNDDDSSENSSRMFSNIVSGSVAIPDSTLVVCNRSFIEYISLDQIKQAATSYSHECLTPYFQNLLGKANTQIDFAALFLRMSVGRITDASSRAGNHSQTVTQHSMEDLVGTEHDTEAILSPAVGSQAKDMIISMSKKIIITPAKWLVSFTASRVKNISLPNPSTVIKKEAILKNLESTRGLMKEKGHNLIIAFHKLRKKDKKQVLQDALSTIREKGISNGTALKDKVMALPPVSKAILVVAVIFIALFAVSIMTQQSKQNEAKALKEYNSLVSSIGQQANLAEASLIYEDEAKSKSFLDQAKNLLAKLPTTTPEQQKKHDELKTQIDLVQNKISHLMPLNTTVVAQLENQIPTLESLKMTAVGDTTLLYNRDSVYTLDTKAGKVTQINTQAKVPQITCAIPYNSTIVYLCGSAEGALFELSLKDQIAKPVSIKNESGISITAATSYNGRLYFVDGTTGTLYRHSKLNDGFGSATILADKIDALKNTQSIAIDGNVFVMAGNQLEKVANKQVTQVAWPSIEPPITSPSDMWTSDDSNYLYITEPSQKRITVIDKKTNKVKVQLITSNLDSIKSISVNEKKHEIFILNGAQVLKASLDFIK